MAAWYVTAEPRVCNPDRSSWPNPNEMTSDDWADAQYQATRLIRKHFWLERPPAQVRPGWTMGREMSVFKVLARDHGVAEVLGAIGVARGVLGIPPGRPMTLLLLNKQGRRDRLHQCIAEWRKACTSTGKENVVAFLRDSLRAAAKEGK